MKYFPRKWNRKRRKGDRTKENVYGHSGEEGRIALSCGENMMVMMYFLKYFIVLIHLIS